MENLFSSSKNITHMQTCLHNAYLTVLERKLAGSMDVHPYFSKYGHRVSRKYGNRNVNECKFVASEVER